MADTAAALVIQLTAETRAFQREMKKASGAFDAEGRKIERRQAQLAKNVQKGFAQLGGAVSAAAVIAFGRSILNTADALSDASAQLGITVQELQGLDYAARLSGASSDKLALALSFLADGLGEAERGEGALAEAMRRNGIQMGTTLDVLYDVADRVKAARTETERMNIATTYLGARGGKTMVSFLKQGAEGLKALQEEAAAKGQIWDPATLARLDSAKDSFETLEKAVVNMAALPASEFINDLAGFIDALSNGDWQAGLNRLAQLLPAIAGAVGGGLVGGPIGAVVGGVAGIGLGAALFPGDTAPASAARSKTRRTGVPNSPADAAKALRDATRIREIIAGAAEDASRSADDANDALRETVRAQSQALLTRMQGSVQYADIQKEVIEESARLDVAAINDRRDADIRALELRERQERDHLAELKASAAEQATLSQSYAEQRVNIEARAASEITAIQAKTSADIAQIRTREIQVNDELRSGLEDVAAAGLHGFDSLKDAAAGFLEQIAEMILRMYVLKPLLESVLGPAGTTIGGGGLGSLIGSILPFAKGGVMTPNGPRALQRYAGGGVSRRAAIFGEAGPEAAVPLPDGRRIPVEIRQPTMPAGAGMASAGPVIQFDLRGAVMTEDLLRQMQTMSDRAANRGAAQGARLAIKAQPTRAAQARALEQ